MHVWSVMDKAAHQERPLLCHDPWSMDSLFALSLNALYIHFEGYPTHFVQSLYYLLSARCCETNM